VLLTRSLSTALLESEIDQINISLNGLSDTHYEQYTQRKIKVENLIEEVRYLCRNSEKTTIYIKCIKEHLTTEEQDLFLQIFSGYADKIYLEGLQPNWPQFEFDYIKVKYEKGHYGQELLQREVCPFIFYMMVVNSDGSISACVQDWNHELIIGNARSSTLLDIWNGPDMNKLRRSHLEKKRKDYQNCSSCPVLLHGCLDNIDPYAAHLLPYYQ